MATERALRVPLTKTRSQAVFIVLVLLANLFVGSLSTGSTYAHEMSDAAIDDMTHTTQEIVTPEEPQQPVEYQSNTEGSPERPERPERPDKPELVQHDQPHEDDNDSINETESDQDSSDMPEGVTIDVVFDCWQPNSAEDYLFRVTVEASEPFTADHGSSNYTDPEEYSMLMPTEFAAGMHTYEVVGWDGQDFRWHLADQQVRIQQTRLSECEHMTLLDVIESSTEHTLLAEAIETASDENGECTALINQLDTIYAGPFTVFAPTDEAISQLVRFPGQLDDELKQLEANPDEMCALVASHIIMDKVLSTDVTSNGQTLFAVQNDTDGIHLMATANAVTANNATVVTADIEADNGVVHAVDQVILPQSIATIDPIKTDKTSPALSGTIEQALFTPTTQQTQSAEVCVLVRIDGIPYAATTHGNTWSIDEGVVMLNPTKSDTLFDVIVRTAGGIGCSDESDLNRLERSGEHLLGLTMVRGVVSYLEPVAAPNPTEVLGVSDQQPEATVEPVVAAVLGTGKGGDVAQLDPSSIDTDGDGVVDSEDLDPNDPAVTGRDTDGDGVIDSEDPDPNDPTVTTQEDEQVDEDTTDNEDQSTVFWWFVVGGGAVVLAYLLRQRGGTS